MRNKLFFVILAIIAIAILVLVQPQYVPAPAKDGPGPLAVKINSRLVAPEYHNPIGWWRTHHMDALNGGDFTQANCLYCHDPATSCNNCHSYVGVKLISAQ